MDIWAANIMDHYRHPRNFGELKSADFEQAGANSSCGDSLKVSLKIDERVITGLNFTGQGCTISVAAMSILTDSLIGRTIEEVNSFSIEYIESLLGIKVSPRRQNCALLGLKTVQKALRLDKNVI